MRVSTLTVFALALVLPALAAPIDLSGSELASVADGVGSKVEETLGKSTDDTAAVSDSSTSDPTGCTVGLSRRGGKLSCMSLEDKYSNVMELDESVPLAQQIKNLPPQYVPYAMDWSNLLYLLTEDMPALEAHGGYYAGNAVRQYKALMTSVLNAMEANGGASWESTGNYAEDISNLVGNMQRYNTNTWATVDRELATFTSNFDELLSVAGIRT